MPRVPAFSPALRAAVVFGISGVGFVGANLVFARVMTPADYAIVSLVIALVQIAMPLGPLGLDTLVARRAIEPQRALLGRALATSAATGAAAALVGVLVYRLDTVLVLLILASSVAGGANLVASAVYQGRRRFGPALALSQSQNGVLAAAAVLVAFATVRAPWLPCTVYAIGYVASAGAGWWLLLRHPREARRESLGASELLSLAGLTAATLVLIQLERLVIPRRLSLADLALYGVLAAVAGSPYRVLQQGVGYTLLPRLRGAGSPEERRRLVRREARNGGAVTVLASAGIWLLASPLVTRLLAGKYALTDSLLLAAILAGVAKVGSAFATAAATALCTEKELAHLRHLAWLSLAVSAGACWYGARWGVEGVIYGAAVGWTGLALAGAALAAPHFRARTTVM
ncbi:MAG: oligosaccharide flippase family protein [bacterium]